MTPELPPEDVERVVRVQKLVRSRLARRRVAALAGGVYRKCFDVASGLAYYCNMRTGGASWFKPALLGKSDAEWLEFQPDQEQPGDVDARTSSGEGSTALPSDLKARATGDESPDAALDRLNSTEWHERFAESVAFQNKCRAEKLALVRRHRRQVARAMRDWDRKALADKQRARAGRLAQLASDNQQLKQSLRDGSSRQNTESIREAALRGHSSRVQELLALGFSPDAESAMGLTPLLAACQSSHVDVARLLLASGADVNHLHVKTGRSALMEACSRTDRALVKELLRYGARIHVRDAHGETVFECMSDCGIQEVVGQACGVWDPENAALFPREFRAAALTLALVGSRQRTTWTALKSSTRRELIQTKQRLQREFVETRVRHDESLRGCSMAPSVLRRLAVLEEADERFDAERRGVVTQLQSAVDSLRLSEVPRLLPESVVCRILSFCSRYWFESGGARRTKRSKEASRRSIARGGGNQPAVTPIKLRDPPDQLPSELQTEWCAFQRTLQATCAQLSAAQAVECFDATSGVAKTSTGESLAELDVHVVQAEHLPWRDPRTHDMMDPFVRVYLRQSSITSPCASTVQSFDSELRIGTRDPVWDFQCRLLAIPSTQCEIAIQVIDSKRNEAAGEVCVPLRSLLDQREHGEWLVLPPTLRQQVLEKTPRQFPARLYVKLTFSHTKSIVLTRELQARLKVRDAILRKQREHTQQVVNALLLQLP